MKRWCIGVDPGFRETGAVLFLDEGEETPVAAATWSCTNTADDDLPRAVALAGEVVTQIIAWIRKYEIEHLDISIETPIYKRNAATFIKQIRLLQEIESGIFHIVEGEVKELWLTEVNPITSKRLATDSGKATKADMIRCSPYRDTEVRAHTKETLADAWAHGLAAWTTGTRVRVTGLRVAEVENEYEDGHEVSGEH